MPGHCIAKYDNVWHILRSIYILDSLLLEALHMLVNSTWFYTLKKCRSALSSIISTAYIHFKDVWPCNAQKLPRLWCCHVNIRTLLILPMFSYKCNLISCVLKISNQTVKINSKHIPGKQRWESILGQHIKLHIFKLHLK